MWNKPKSLHPTAQQRAVDPICFLILPPSWFLSFSPQIETRFSHQKNREDFFKGEQPEGIGKERYVFFAEKYDSDWSILREILIVVYYVLAVSAFIKNLSLSPLLWGHFFI